jgi:hypothetical protein
MNYSINNVPTYFASSIFTVSKRYGNPATGSVVAQRVGRVIALLFHDLGTRMG